MNLAMNMKWNKSAQCWVVDILDESGAALLSGVHMVTGSDLLSQFRYMGFGGKLMVQTDGDITAVPTFENLGVQGRLYFIADPAS